MRQDLKDNQIKKVGEINYNKSGNKMEIINYFNARNIVIKFENNFTVTTTYNSFKKGTIKNPYEKSVYNIGYLGEGKYKSKVNNKKTKQYKSWIAMFQRCYNIKCLEYRPTYIECTICEEWHSFQNYGKWFDNNYYEIENEKIEIDKDILTKGNKIYSPETCVFVPQNINKLFTKHGRKRGLYPIGVYYRKNNNKYRSQCCNNGEKYLGDYNTPEEAFLVYKNYKEKIIKNIADNYKNIIPEKLYYALYNYKIDIND